jgi:phenylacetate-coenzyme A ligase PaaK-like adenylate-forming protein
MLNDFFDIDPYSLAAGEKSKLLLKRLVHLTQSHYENSPAYKNILDALQFNFDRASCLCDIPFLPVQIFKARELSSVPKESVVKTMTSSGTTGQAVSKIYLDKNTAGLQQKTLAKLVSDFLGTSRLPMLIIDSPSVIKNRNLFSARGAGILGFSVFGTDRTYALNDEMNLDLEAIDAFLKKHEGEKIFLFGFTFLIWEKFLAEIKKEGKRDFSNAVLIHGGGWKRLASKNISSKVFRSELLETLGIKNVHDYYGMVEQTGAVYFECERGHLHASIFSDVIMRDYKNFSPLPVGEMGIVQVLSSLPESYPGHSLLTEDEGVLLGEDDCPCGRKGKYFRILGRLKNAEIRGCGDTFEGA